MSIKLIIGLQNPGPSYANTRHNAGSWFVEQLAAVHHLSFKLETKLHAAIANWSQNEVSIKLALPTTYMNHSGRTLRAIAQFYKILPSEILVAHDELDLSPGAIRLKTSGGHGGHNGLRDIITQLGVTDFHRLRLGIGHPGHKDDVVDYVLSKPSKTDELLIGQAINRAIDVMPRLLNEGLPSAMTYLNERNSHGI